MKEQTKKDILEYARECLPREACGLIVNCSGKEVFYPCWNLAEGNGHFILDPVDYAAAEEDGQVVAVVHSHVEVPATPSMADLVSCDRSGLPWHIVSLPTETWAYLEPSGYKAPLLGREFSHGVLDCYSLIQDWYKEELGIELKDFDRREEWWKKGDDLYMAHFREAGFEVVEDLQRGDVLLMQIGADVVNHAGIYLGDGLFIHHHIGRLSCRDVFGGFWKKNTRLFIRYRGVE